MNSRFTTVSILHIVGSVLAVFTAVLVVVTPWLVINQTDGSDYVARYTMNGSFLPSSFVLWQADAPYFPHSGFRFGWVIIVVLLIGMLCATYLRSTEKWSALAVACTGGFTFVLLLFSIIIRDQIIGAKPSELDEMAARNGDYLDISYSMGLGFWAVLVLTLAITALGAVRFLMSSGLIRRTPAPAAPQGWASQQQFQRPQQPQQFPSAHQQVQQQQVQQFPPAQQSRQYPPQQYPPQQDRQYPPQQDRQYPPQQGGQWGAGSSPFGR